MKTHLLSLLSILLVLSCHIVGAVEPLNKSNSSIDFQYHGLVDGRYLALTILHDGKSVRTLRGDMDSTGTFEREDSPQLSADGNFVLLSQVQSGKVVMPNGSVMDHEVTYCNLVNLQSGCIVARETGQFCGGSFTLDSKWENPLYLDFDLPSETPTANDYAQGWRRPANSPETSFANLLACDPPSDANADAYRSIESRRLFDLDSSLHGFIK